MYNTEYDFRELEIVKNFFRNVFFNNVNLQRARIKIPSMQSYTQTAKKQKEREHTHVQVFAEILLSGTKIDTYTRERIRA